MLCNLTQSVITRWDFTYQVDLVRHARVWVWVYDAGVYANQVQPLAAMAKVRGMTTRHCVALAPSSSPIPIQWPDPPIKVGKVDVVHRFARTLDDDVACLISLLARVTQGHAVLRFTKVKSSGQIPRIDPWNEK